MANKYVDIRVLQYAVQSLSQAITNTFTMRNATVTSIDIVKAIPTALISTSTEEVYCLRIKYADDGQIKDGVTVAHAIDLALSDIIADSKLKIEVVSALPNIADAKENTLYFVPNSETSGNDLFDEYVLTNGAFELLGHAKLDLSPYYTSTEIDTKLNNYYTKTEVDGLVPDITGLITETDVDTKLSNYYNKTEVDGKIPDLSDYYKKSETYSQSEIDTKLSGVTVDLSDYYNKTEVDSKIPDVSSFITDSDVNTKLNDYYTKIQVDAKIPDVSGYITETAVNTKLNSYYKKTETYNKTELDAKLVEITPDMSEYYKKTDVDTTFKNYYKKTEVDTKLGDYYKKTDVYTKTEVNDLLDDKANQTDVDVLTSKVSQIFSSMVDNTTLDGIVQDIKKQVADKLEDSDLNIIRSDISNLQTKVKNLEDNKLNKTDLPTKVSAFENDAKYQTDEDIAAADAQTLADAKTYVNNRIADINTLDPEAYYSKAQTNNILTDYYKKTETYNKTELDTKFSSKAGLNVASETSNGLLSAELFSIIKDIDPENMGKNGEDGVTPEIEVVTVGKTTTVTFTTGDDIKTFSVTTGTDGKNGTDGVSITGGKISTKNHLVLNLSNGKTIDVGNIISEALEITNVSIDNNSNLIFTMSDGSTKNAGNVRGEKGRGITKIAIDDDTHEIIVTYDDGSTDNAGMIEGVKGEKGDTGEKGAGLTSLAIQNNQDIIATYEDGTTENIGTITGAKGDTGTSIANVACDTNNNVIITMSDGNTYNLGDWTGATGKGIKNVGVNSDYELILTMTDDTIINAGVVEVNVKDIFVTSAELNEDGELIFTFSDGSTQNKGKINGAEGFSIREYVKLQNGQAIKSGCMMLWENMIYKVVTDFTCTTNFNTDKANMQKITTEAVLEDLYNVYYVQVPAGTTPMTFNEWMHQWFEEKFDNSIVSHATIINNRERYYGGSFYNLTYKDCVGGDVFNGSNIKLPHDGAYLLVVDSGNRGSASRGGERYSYLYNATKGRYEFHTSIYSIQSTDYNVAYPGFSQVINGKAGDIFQVKVKNRYETVYGAEVAANIYLYKLVDNNHIINPEDLYTMYLSTVPAETTPLTKDEWIKSVVQRDGFRMEGVFNQSYTDVTDVLLTGFEFSNGDEDLMCDTYGRFYAPYSGLYYIRLQLRLETSNIYPSRFYLVKNGKFGEEGYSSKVISQSTEGYMTNSAYLQSLNSVFWLTKGDYFTIGFQSSVKDTNTLKSISNFEYGLVGGGSGGGGSLDSGSASSGIQLYNTLGIGSLVRKDAVIQYQRRLYRVTENFYCTDVFTQDKEHMQQFYGSGHGIIDYDDIRIDNTEEFLPGEFIIKRKTVNAIDEQGNSYTADVDDLYEVVTTFTRTGNFDTDKVNLKKVLGSFDDYDTVVKKLEEEIDAINQTNSDLEDIIDDLASILDDINRTVV